MAKRVEVETDTLPPVERTSAGLRSALYDEMDRMRSGKTNATNANAMARLVDQVCNTVYMELEVHKHLSKTPATADVAAMPKPLVLGLGV